MTLSSLIFAPRQFATKVFIRVHEAALRRKRAQAMTEYMLIIGLIVTVFLIICAIMAAVQLENPD